MPSLDDLLGRIPVSDIATRLGVDEATAAAAVEQALPALVSGLEANTFDPSGAASLERAVSQHSATLVDGTVNLDDVDPADGEKIVSHIFGEHKDQVVATLSDGSTQPASFAGSSVVGKLLPILAPIVLSYLAKQFSERKQSAETAQPTEPMQSRVPKPEKEPEGGLGGILGGLLGGGKAESTAGSGGIGEILGGLLGGDSRASDSIGHVLGSLLGGGRR
ncbi:hypothetical protein L1277_002445 [Okibacterium sp. HSC-33S16]|uniref:DUF937 domain-containing protein n=1 Tax=Okibacterium sp. HSC-33S16 TaxID=2910965 RepID=UPI00209D5F14|nr:DUF937 domain-containing protein [Okibacterium sp. HSC-33S16]MCP2032342.1 hypothetical protein [Okibacterium sp. HSC-33S16]